MVDWTEKVDDGKWCWTGRKRLEIDMITMVESRSNTTDHKTNHRTLHIRLEFAGDDKSSGSGEENSDISDGVTYLLPTMEEVVVWWCPKRRRRWPVAAEIRRGGGIIGGNEKEVGIVGNEVGSVFMILPFYPFSIKNPY